MVIGILQTVLHAGKFYWLSGFESACLIIPLLLAAVVHCSSQGPDPQSAVHFRQTDVPTKIAGGRDLYVSRDGADSNRGSRCAPFRTIQRAADSSKPGDAVHVLPGVYPESVIVHTGGTSSEHIRYVSDVKWAAKITGGYDRAAFRVQSGSYVDIVGFDITNTTGTQGIEMYASGGSILC